MMSLYKKKNSLHEKKLYGKETSKPGFEKKLKESSKAYKKQKREDAYKEMKDKAREKYNTMKDASKQAIENANTVGKRGLKNAKESSKYVGRGIEKKASKKRKKLADKLFG